MRRIQFVALIILSVLLQSCGLKEGGTIITTGTMDYRSDVLDFKGFYFIVADDGKEYYPVNLSGEFQQAGLRVRFEAREVDRGPGIVGWGDGPVIELVHIQKIPT
jgi:major membrane immunogen (membrane-anchored lipoprotein)